MRDTLRDRVNELFSELVPATGKCDTEAGEIVRAYCRIAYRWDNDGDKVGVGYGNETCNAAARYLLAHDHDNAEVLASIRDMWGNYSDVRYEDALERLGGAVLSVIEDNPSTFDAETEDMWDHFDRFEDVDYEEDEDEEW